MNAQRSSQAVDRRGFLKQSALAALALATGVTGCRHGRHGGGGSSPHSAVAFNTANLVARVTQYRFELKNWGEQHQKTVAAMTEDAWSDICRDIAAAGFRYVEIWEAHASPDVMTPQKAALWSSIMRGYDLRPVAYAGTLRRESLLVCQWLKIPHIDGGLGGLKPDEATELCKEHKVRFNLENHPQKTSREILDAIGGGNEWLGVCIDTGWLGTQGASAPEIIRECGKTIRHTHIKDVRAAGAHETCLLGTGVVGMPAVFDALKEVGYRGSYSWEDEPENRNPLDTAIENRRYIERQLARVG